jgi:hypothetical protein
MTGSSDYLSLHQSLIPVDEHLLEGTDRPGQMGGSETRSSIVKEREQPAISVVAVSYVLTKGG